MARPSDRSYRFLLSPRWLAFHVAMAALAILMINLAFWQLRRLDERTARNDAISERTEQAPISAPRANPLGDEWTLVSATGTYDAAQQLLVDNRSLNGPGFHVIVPLRRADGDALLVNRGWIGLVDGQQGRVPPPPEGTVTITARVRPTQLRGAFGPSIPADGTLTHVARVDVERIAKQVPYSLITSGYVELVEQQPAATAPPVLIPLPERNNGPHLAYAVQWFVFSACVAVGWVIAVRKSADQRRLQRQLERQVESSTVADGAATGSAGVEART